MEKLLRTVEQILGGPATFVVEAAKERGLAVEPAAPVAKSISATVPPAGHRSFDLDRPLREAREEFERSYFEFHLTKENGNLARVVEKAGIKRTHLYRKLKQLGLDLSATSRRGR